MHPLSNSPHLHPAASLGGGGVTGNFIDESNGEPTSWQWDFQNDGIYDSYEQNPTFIYNYPGIYDVKLKIDGSTFVDSLVKYNYITVSDTLPPIAEITPGSFCFFLEQGESDNDILTISNTGPTNLAFSIEKEYPQFRGSGGPDAFGYTWKDSDEPEPDSLEYNWIDISNNSTEVVFTHNNLAVEFTRPIDWLSLDENNGIIFPDESMNTQFWVYTDELEEGEYLCNLQITTNDPENNLVTIPVNLNIGPIVLTPPENVIISYDLDSIIISWDPVTFATSYKVYSSDSPYTGLVEDTTGTFVGESWSTSIINEKKFYFVKASTEIY